MKNDMERNDEMSEMSEMWNKVKADYTVRFAKSGYNPDDDRPCDYFVGEGCTFVRMAKEDDENIAEWFLLDLKFDGDFENFDVRNDIYAPGEHVVIKIIDEEHGVRAIERIGDTTILDETDYTACKEAPYYYKGEVNGIDMLKEYSLIADEMKVSEDFKGFDEETRKGLCPEFVFENLIALTERELEVLFACYPRNGERVADEDAAKALGMTDKQLKLTKRIVFAKYRSMLEDASRDW